LKFIESLEFQHHFSSKFNGYFITCLNATDYLKINIIVVVLPSHSQQVRSVLQSGEIFA